jgi:branched-chain amino acid transport system ATP-binding protein
MLEVQHLTVRYGAGALAVEGVGLQVDPGRVVTLIGPNGAGKTTTLRAIGGFLRSETGRVTGGSIKWNGREVRGLEPHVMAKLGVVAVPERKKVFPNLTVQENLGALRPLTRRQRRDGIERVVELFPVLAERMRQAAGLLSGGQQQMLAIARALILEPQLLLLDEMTLGLHPSVQAQLREVVRRIADSGTAVFVVDEGDGVLEVADEVVVMSGGRVRAAGPRSDFAEQQILEELFLAG